MAQTHPRIPLAFRICRSNPFLDPDSHLSLGEIARRETELAWRAKLRRSGLHPTPSDDTRWGKFNRVPRRPPIYRTDPEVA